MFSKACEYGIRAVLYIAKQSQEDKRPNVAEIAKAVDSPEPFTAKICQQLARSGVVLSKKGPNGGFYVENGKDIRLIDIVRAIDGNKLFTGCGLGFKECSETKPCPIHFEFKHTRDALEEMLINTSVFKISEGLEKGLVFLRK